MLVDEKTRAILLPNDDTILRYKIVKFPVDMVENKFKSFLVEDDRLYEIIEIKGNNPHITTQKPLLKNEGAVKSFIFEGETSGSVLQSPNLLVCTKFNLTYILIPIFSHIESMLKRYVSFEDIIDTLTSSFVGNNDWITQVSEKMMLSSLKPICECITENDEEFFKFSASKTFTFIDSKIRSLAEFIRTSDSSIGKRLGAQLQDSATNSATPPKEMTDLLALRYAVEMVCGNLVKGKLREEMIAYNKYNFETLDAYVKELEIKNKDIRTVEKNMSEISSISAKSKNEKTDTKKKVKKEVKKVAAGKGALDSFFKRA